MDEDVLDTPRDGIYIPSALLIMGMGILAYYLENPLIFVGGIFITLGLAGLKLYRGSGSTLFRGQNDLNDLEKEDPEFLTAHSKLKLYEMAVSEKVLINNDTSIYTIDLPSPETLWASSPASRLVFELSGTPRLLEEPGLPSSIFTRFRSDLDLLTLSFGTTEPLLTCSTNTTTWEAVRTWSVDILME